MSHTTLIDMGLPAAGLFGTLVAVYVLSDSRQRKLRQRIARVTRRKGEPLKKNVSAGLSLRRKKDGNLPLISNILAYLPTQTALKARLERAGLKVSADKYMMISIILTLVTTAIVLALRKPVIMALVIGALVGVFLPHKVVGWKGDRRVKKFLLLFPDAIEYIVRGLRSGLPATESMNMVGTEMEEPIGSIFSSIGESVKLGVPVDKALQDTARKLGSTEFNFFVTSIILQRETGGNLSEILNNLAEVLRSRTMMRMKIKAMSSEAKASAIIVGSLPFLVMIALLFISPGYLDLLWTDRRGNIAAAGAATSLMMGVGIMRKMSRFEL